MFFQCLFSASVRFEIRPSSESKIGMNAAGVHFIQLYRNKKVR